jgi:hypothetical protein
MGRPNGREFYGTRLLLSPPLLATCYFRGSYPLSDNRFDLYDITIDLPNGVWIQTSCLVSAIDNTWVSCNHILVCYAYQGRNVLIKESIVPK